MEEARDLVEANGAGGEGAAAKEKLPRTVDLPDGGYEIHLKYPLNEGKNNPPLAVLVIPRLLAMHIEAIPCEGAKFGDLLNAAALAAKKPPSILRNLTNEDIREVMALVSKCMGGGPGTSAS